MCSLCSLWTHQHRVKLRCVEVDDCKWPSAGLHWTTNLSRDSHQQQNREYKRIEECEISSEQRRWSSYFVIKHASHVMISVCAISMLWCRTLWHQANTSSPNCNLSPSINVEMAVAADRDVALSELGMAFPVLLLLSFTVLSFYLFSLWLLW